MAADLDLALWQNIGQDGWPAQTRGTGRLTPHRTPSAWTDRPEKVGASQAAAIEARTRRRFELARLTPAEVAEARHIIQHKGYSLDEAVGIVVRSRREAQPTTEPA